MLRRGQPGWSGSEEGSMNAMNCWECINSRRIDSHITILTDFAGILSKKEGYEDKVAVLGWPDAEVGGIIKNAASLGSIFDSCNDPIRSK